MPLLLSYSREKIRPDQQLEGQSTVPAGVNVTDVGTTSFPPTASILGPGLQLVVRLIKNPRMALLRHIGQSNETAKRRSSANSSTGFQNMSERGGGADWRSAEGKRIGTEPERRSRAPRRYVHGQIFAHFIVASRLPLCHDEALEEAFSRYTEGPTSAVYQVRIGELQLLRFSRMDGLGCSRDDIEATLRSLDEES